MLDAKRGFDHGHFIPLKLMYPQADIPTVQLSLLSSLDPEVGWRTWNVAYVPCKISLVHRRPVAVLLRA